MTKDFEKIKEEAKKEVDKETIEGIDFKTLEKKVKKWLLVKDSGIIKLICATVIANQLPTDPVWLFLVASSGGSKTELLQALNKIPVIYPLSSLTPQTFISGMKGKDVSLLPKINNKILVFKDFTTILESHPQAQSEILAQLREIYDGSYKREFGTGKSIEWKGKLGFLAGTTPIIDKCHTVHKSLGERFLQYRIIQPNRKIVLERMKANALLRKKMKEELANAFAGFIKTIEIPKNIKEIPRPDKEIDKRIGEIADFISRARSSVIRDNWSRDKDIVFVPAIEMSTRIYLQLYTVAMGLLIVNGGEFKKEDFKIIYKLGFDSLHYLRRKILIRLRKYKGWVKSSTIATGLNYTTKTIRKYLEDLNVLEIVKRHKPRENLDLWRIKPRYLKMWEDCMWDKTKIKQGYLIDEEAEKEAGREREVVLEKEEKNEEIDPKKLEF